MSVFLPYGRQTIGEDDVAAVADALRADYLTTGPLVARYEEAFASATGAGSAVVSNSGTAALHLAALAVGLGPGDTAIVPSLTFLATANAVRMTGAEVEFADVDADSGLMRPADLGQALDRAKSRGARVKAAFPVHLNGQVCDMAALAAVAGADGVSLIEDACHALGAEDAGACRHSFAACFSTHPVKAIATGEGGVTTTSDAQAATRMRSLRSHGMVREPAAFRNVARAIEGGAVNPWYYEMAELGWNYRLPDILCALGLSQLPKLSAFHARRVAIACCYDRWLAPLAPNVRPVARTGARHGWHLYAVLVDFASLRLSRTAVMTRLTERGIGSQVHYAPVHTQPYYRERYGALELPGAENYYARCLSIPMYPGLADDQVQRVVDAIGDIVAGNAAS